jgi:hypothetical protein
MKPWLDAFDSAWAHAVSDLAYPNLLSFLNQESTRRSLVTGGGQPLRFVAQSELPPHEAYEAWIAKTGCVPTRDNRHDRLNALIWLTYPQSKARLNQLQAQAISQMGVGPSRGALRDAMTLCDENLLLICAKPLGSMSDSSASIECEVLIRQHDWSALFLNHRERWANEWAVFPFGHALLEKLDQPYKSLTAHVLVLDPSRRTLDECLSESLHEAMTPRDLLVLPVMGIPGWDTASEARDFYSDTSVFRASRRTDKRGTT